MTLSLRIALLLFCLTATGAVTVWSSVSALLEDVIEEWGERYAEKQALYDQQRTLAPIIRELKLTRQLARSPLQIAFARDPGNPELRRKALQELENYRLSFSEGNYFLALANSREYFHNNAENSYQGRQLRYRLNPEAEKDAWFYQLIEQGRDLHINVNPDPELQVTKLWINVLLRDGDQILGVLGTGLALEPMMQLVSSEREAGISAMMTDFNGAIQLYYDRSLMNYSSISHSPEEQHRAKDLLSRSDDRQWLQESYQQAAQQPGRVFSRYVQHDNSRHLLALSYLPQIDWYAITLVDVNTLLPLSRFSGVLAATLLTLLFWAAAVYLTMRTLILRPLRQLQQEIAQLDNTPLLSEKTAGEPPSGRILSTRGELARLLQQFKQMAQHISEHQQQLEQKVQARTRALEQASNTDGMTGLLNRRGMMQQLENAFAKAGQAPFTRTDQALSLIWLDLDYFKALNDRYGHHQGDQALVAMSEVLRQQVDQSGIGISARWGGDEFLACVQVDDDNHLMQLCETIRREIAAIRPAYYDHNNHDHNDHDHGNTGHGENSNHLPLTASIGACIAGPDDRLHDSIQKADAALYRAKAGGRNTVRLTGTQPENPALIRSPRRDMPA